MQDKNGVDLFRKELKRKLNKWTTGWESRIEDGGQELLVKLVRMSRVCYPANGREELPRPGREQRLVRFPPALRKVLEKRWGGDCPSFQRTLPTTQVAASDTLLFFHHSFTTTIQYTDIVPS